MIEYLPTPQTKPGNEWCIREDKAFLAEYAIHKDDIPLWHEVMVGQGRFWQIARLRYRISPVFDLSAEAVDMQRPWNIAEIAERLSQPLAVIDAELSQTWRYWTQQRAERKNQSIIPDLPNLHVPATTENTAKAQEEHRAAATATAPSSNAARTASASLPTTDEKLPSFSSRKVAVADAERILTELGISLYDDAEKVYIASRAICFESWLNDPLTREFALNVINMEIVMRTYRRNLDQVSRLLDGKVDAAKRTELMKEMRETEKVMRDLATSYHKALDELGGEQSAVEDMKREAINTLGFVTQAMAKYRSKGDCSLIDGVFSAKEVIWLTTPVPMRPGQYRPDIVAVIKDAMKPENLFDEKYQPPAITREVCRRLNRMTEIFEAEMGVVDNRNTVVEAPAEMDDEDKPTSSSSNMISPFLSVEESSAAGGTSSVLPFAFSHRTANEEEMISFIPS